MRSRASSASSTDARATVAVVGALSVAAWAALGAWAAAGAELDHDALGESDALLAAPALVGGWTLMIVAMMLPTTLALVGVFRRVVARRGRPGRLVAALLAGYLVAWSAFGAALHAGDLVAHALVDSSPWLAANEWLLAAGAFALAGGFQFSSLKGRCLDRCRSPRMFVSERWRGREPALEAARIGVEHGAWCIGCCWALMLVMFAVGVASFAWMLALGALMAIEKNLPWGRRASAPAGAALLALAIAAAAPPLV